VYLRMLAHEPLRVCKHALRDSVAGGRRQSRRTLDVDMHDRYESLLGHASIVAAPSAGGYLAPRWRSFLAGSA
jgi:hypothetical protein